MAAAPPPSLRSEEEAAMIIQAARIAMFGSPLFPTFSPRGEKGQEQSPAKAGGFTDSLFETLNRYAREIVGDTSHGTSPDQLRDSSRRRPDRDLRIRLERHELRPDCSRDPGPARLGQAGLHAVSPLPPDAGGNSPLPPSLCSFTTLSRDSTTPVPSTRWKSR